MARFRVLGSSLVVLEGPDGEVLLRTPSLGGVLACRSTILSIRMNALLDEAYERSKTAQGWFSFRLREPAGALLATSAPCRTEADREHAIDLVRRVAPIALVTHSATLLELVDDGVAPDAPAARDDDDPRDRSHD